MLAGRLSDQMSSELGYYFRVVAELYFLEVSINIIMTKACKSLQIQCFWAIIKEKHFKHRDNGG